MQGPAATSRGLVEECQADPTRISPLGHLLLDLPAFCPQIPPIVPVLPTHKPRAFYNLAVDALHGMEV